MKTLSSHLIFDDQLPQLTITALEGSRYEIRGLDRNANPDKGNMVFISDVETIMFQSGPVAPSGPNGLSEESLLAILIDRLSSCTGPVPAGRQESLRLCNQALFWLKRSRQQ